MGAIRNAAVAGSFYAGSAVALRARRAWLCLRLHGGDSAALAAAARTGDQLLLLRWMRRAEARLAELDALDCGLLRLHHATGRQYRMQEKQRILADDIVDGRDELGVVHLSHDPHALRQVVRPDKGRVDPLHIQEVVDVLDGGGGLGFGFFNDSEVRFASSGVVPTLSAAARETSTSMRPSSSAGVARGRSDQSSTLRSSR